jgi:hypothetical protein
MNNSFQGAGSLLPRKSRLAQAAVGKTSRATFVVAAVAHDAGVARVGVLRRPGPTFLASCPICGTEQHFRLSYWTGLATDADPGS